MKAVFVPVLADASLVRDAAPPAQPKAAKATWKHVRIRVANSASRLFAAVRIRVWHFFCRRDEDPIFFVWNEDPFFFVWNEDPVFFVWIEDLIFVMLSWVFRL